MVTELLLQRHNERVRHDREYEWAIRISMILFGLVIVLIPLAPLIAASHHHPQQLLARHARHTNQGQGISYCTQIRE